ncbi:MAG: amidohydrolase [Candidatus Eremiobacteraeota bacterium]|nr:amidohydrolase [Candidatus Eremiobacteraeota bacterium]
MTVEVSSGILERVVATRRDLHAHPELGFQEHRTAALVAARLRELGLEVHERIAQTGVLGIVKGGRPGKTIMLRADMDALPIREQNEAAYRSTNDAMHACGHDGHVAILLGAAQILSERRAEICGTVVLCFQPAEEGLGGARAMVEAGILGEYGIERAYGLHLSSQHPTGKVGFRAGQIYASSDSIEIAIHGKGGHGAAPHLSIDPIYVASSFVVAVQQVVSRVVNPVEPAVVTIGSFQAGTTYNVIPTSAKLLGTVRAFDAGVRAEMSGRIERVLAGICAASGATYDFNYIWRYPVTSNDAEQTEYARALGERTLGAEHIEEFPKIMGAEDFSFFAEKVPACFYQVGCRGDERSSFPHHHERFDIDERALEYGVRMMVALGLDAGANAP